ncbi:peptidylprolyl isomerase [Mesorhizobium sp. STM 4661]|uniref:peptidylprolyl isomerase n=1 Tax=Mesorhizobium sp. STM 4661 TaxID=1297570 RepID=UPI0012FB53A7|nr:peptidylprolyl isomerase [Mesorhizobium sp. STM 4661]
MTLRKIHLKARAPFRLAACAATIAIACLASTAAAPQENAVLARVNGVDITGADLAVAAEMYSDQLGKMPEDARRSVLVDALIELRVVADAAKAANVAETDSFKRQLAFFEAQTLRTIFMDSKVAERVTDEAVRKSYDDQVVKIPPVEEYRLSHVLLATEQQGNDAVAALRSGKDFAELAREVSQDTASKANGGDLGFVSSGQTIAEIDSAAASLQQGEYTQSPVKSAFGFHVVKLDERRKRPAPAFETISGQIRESLEATASQQMLADLRSKAKIEKFVPDVTPPPVDDGHNQQAE